VLLVTGGIMAFMYFDEKDQKKAGGGGDTSLIGLGLCLLSLLMDGYTSPTQEHTYKHHKVPPSAMQFFMNVWATLLVLAFLLVSGQLAPGAAFFMKYPELIQEALLLGVLNALGQAVILFTIHSFNALVVTTVTTTRKLFTLLASVLVYGHHLVQLQWIGVLLVFLGLAMDVQEKYAKYRARRAKVQAAKSHKQG
jgi:UDP-galactose transporter B1